jgi:molybdopterin-synthase adenylyltransferase
MDETSSARGPELDEARIARWARQLLVPGFGAAGQERLMASRVRVVGADALAGPALLALVQAGVGTLWIDDHDLVSPADVGGWLFGPASAGQPRAEAAAAVLGAFSRFTRVQPFPTGAVPTATLVVASSAAQALASAETARRAAIPHVVVDVDGEGGSLTVVPLGAPCYACTRPAANGYRPALPAAAALAALGAQELLQHIADPTLVAGRRIDMVRGMPSVRAPSRLPGCACAPPPKPGPADGASAGGAA